MELADINPKLKHLIDLRSLFGLRTCANTLARMLNPTNSHTSLHGVYHREFDERHIQVANLVNDKNVGCFRGEGGEVEVKADREFSLHLTDENAQNKIIEFPQLFTGRQYKADMENISLLKSVWQNTHKNDYADAAVIGTLAVMISVMEGSKSDVSLIKAKALLHQRSNGYFIS
jgi:anthranilate phosphoribosyltransferase